MGSPGSQRGIPARPKQTHCRKLTIEDALRASRLKRALGYPPPPAANRQKATPFTTCPAADIARHTRLMRGRFTATWSGALIGLVEAGVAGFAFGYTLAKLRNWGMSAYARMVKRRAEAAARRDLLDKV